METTLERKKRFIDIARNNIKRDGIDNLLAYLEKTDFYTAPASTKFHSHYEGGLCEHSLKVYDNLLTLASWKIADNNNLPKELVETVAIVALFHDISKINLYERLFRNVKNEDGQWEKVPYYGISSKKKIFLGHAESSVYMLSKFMSLTLEETTAIRWHMGAFDSAVKGGEYDYSHALKQFPLVMLLHTADNLASTLDEEQ